MRKPLKNSCFTFPSYIKPIAISVCHLKAYFPPASNFFPPKLSSIMLQNCVLHFIIHYLLILQKKLLKFIYSWQIKQCFLIEDLNISIMDFQFRRVFVICICYTLVPQIYGKITSNKLN